MKTKVQRTQRLVVITLFVLDLSFLVGLSAAITWHGAIVICLFGMISGAVALRRCIMSASLGSKLGVVAVWSFITAIVVVGSITCFTHKSYSRETVNGKTIEGSVFLAFVLTGAMITGIAVVFRVLLLTLMHYWTRKSGDKSVTAQ